MLHRLNQFLHWIKTGERQPEPDPASSEIGSDKIYGIQVKENYSGEWDWQITGPKRIAVPNGVYYRGTGFRTKQRAIASAQRNIKAIEKFENQPDWEDVS